MDTLDPNIMFEAEAALDKCYCFYNFVVIQILFSKHLLCTTYNSR